MLLLRRTVYERNIYDCYTFACLISFIFHLYTDIWTDVKQCHHRIYSFILVLPVRHFTRVDKENKKESDQLEIPDIISCQRVAEAIFRTDFNLNNQHSWL